MTRRHAPLGLAAALALASAAQADELVIKRDVTVRQSATRKSAIVTFPSVGSALELLDQGRRVSGYYHARLSDGRSGWVYQTFVERRAAAAPLPAVDASHMAVHYINVDQGAAALLEFSCGAVMIDAGGRGPGAAAHLNDYLNAFFARRPDLNRRIATIFITHTHIDHNSNLTKVVQTFQVGGYVTNGMLVGSGRAAARWMAQHASTLTPPIEAEGLAETEVEAAGANGLTDQLVDPVACAGTDPQIRVISARYDQNPGWPAAEFKSNQNDQSLVIRVDFGKASFLFTGDMEAPALATLLAHHASDGLLDTDVYTVGHHGAENGTTQALLDAVTPKIAVMSFGPSSIHTQWTGWAYGHPRRTTVEMLNRAVTMARQPAVELVADGAKKFSEYTVTRAVYGTGWDGDVTVSADAQGELTVATGQ